MGSPSMYRARLAAFLFTFALPAFAVGFPASVGRWEATADNGSLTVPFHFELTKGPHGLESRLFNGDEPVISDASHVDGDHLVFDYTAFGRVLDLHRTASGTLAGTYAANTGANKVVWQVVAHPATPEAQPGDDAPAIDGLWILPAASKKKNEYA